MGRTVGTFAGFIVGLTDVFTTDIHTLIEDTMGAITATITIDPTITDLIVGMCGEFTAVHIDVVIITEPIGGK